MYFQFLHVNLLLLSTKFNFGTFQIKLHGDAWRFNAMFLLLLMVMRQWYMMFQVLLLDIVDLTSMIDHRYPCVETDFSLPRLLGLPSWVYPLIRLDYSLLITTSLSVWLHVSCVLCVETWWWSRGSASCLQQPSQLSQAEDARPATVTAVIMSFSQRRHWHTDHTSLLASAIRQRTSSSSLLVTSGHLRLPGGSFNNGSSSYLHRHR